MSIHKRIVVILLGLLVLASIFYCIMFLNTNTLFAEANELTRRERLNASGKNKWTAGVICRILNNQTYMGVMEVRGTHRRLYLPIGFCGDNSLWLFGMLRPHRT